MKKLILFSSIGFVLLIIVVLIANSNSVDRNKYEKYLLAEYSNYQEQIIEQDEEVSQDRPDLAAFQNYYTTLDPKIKRVPSERLFQAYQQEKEEVILRKKSTGLVWNELPSNMGGRVRSFMFDPNGAPEWKKVWAGSVTGGLWYNNDITNSDSAWKPANELWESLSVSCIISDTANTEIFYAGTGEAQTAVSIYRESSSKGVGIYKTIDGGESWSLLSSTRGFSYVTDIIIRVENDTSVIYAGVVAGIYKGVAHLATPSEGLFRSKDGGESWTQVLPNIPGESMPYSPSDIELAPNGRIFVGSFRNLYETGGGTLLWSDNGIDWTINEKYKTLIEDSEDPTQDIPGRVMLASTTAAPNSIFAVVAAGGPNKHGFIYYKGRYIIRSDDNGVTWNEVNPPVKDGAWSTLAWHALTIQVSPENADEIFVGGLDLHKTLDGGENWRKLSSWSNFGKYYSSSNLPYVHADQHRIIFKPSSSDTAFFLTDGGVFSSYNASADSLSFQERNHGFNSLQFYTCAIHPGAGESFYVSGAQDNGTLISNSEPLSIHKDMISGGDGAFCFFNTQSPEHLITSVYYNQYYINKFSSGTYELNHTVYEYYSTGIFINPADYNSGTNTLFANAVTFSNEWTDTILRISNITNITYDAELLAVNTGANVPFSAVKVAREGGADILLGTQIGQLFKVENAQTFPTATEIGSKSFPTANISCIEIGDEPNDILVTFSNYGVESVWYSNNCGASWKNVEGNLPDIPVRWAVFNRAQIDQVYLATELGIWYTNNINAQNVVWEQASGFPNIRVDMLKVRASDNYILAATHGRGMFVSILDGDVEPESLSNIENSSSFKIYPNPFSEKLVVEPESFIKEFSIRVFDISGRLIYTTNYSSAANQAVVINTTQWISGTYIVSFENDHEIISRKIIK